MDDFREHLSASVDQLIAAGVEPVLLVVELLGAEEIKRSQGPASFEKFRSSAAQAIASTCGDCDTFTYGEERIGAILPGLARLKTFSLIDRLRRALPYLAQSYDCTIAPEFDIIEYDAQTGVAGFVNHLIALARNDRVA